jgi:hypothetical protein
MGAKSQWGVALALTLWTTTSAAAQEAPSSEPPRINALELPSVAPRAMRPAQVCIVNQSAAIECTPLENLPSRELIERTLFEYAKLESGDLQQLRCEKRDEQQPVTAARATRALRKQKQTKPTAWSSVALERAEQNILALLRSCHAIDLGLQDPVEEGLVPTGAEPWPTVVVSAERTVDELSAEQAPAVEADEPTADAARGPVALAEPGKLEQNVSERPEGVQIVAGYNTLRSSIARVLITWQPNVHDQRQAQAVIDPCLDPIGMPALGECEYGF